MSSSGNAFLTVAGDDIYVYSSLSESQCVDPITGENVSKSFVTYLIGEYQPDSSTLVITTSLLRIPMTNFVGSDGVSILNQHIYVMEYDIQNARAGFFYKIHIFDRHGRCQHSFELKEMLPRTSPYGYDNCTSFLKPFNNSLWISEGNSPNKTLLRELSPDGKLLSTFLVRESFIAFFIDSNRNLFAYNSGYFHKFKMNISPNDVNHVVEIGPPVGKFCKNVETFCFCRERNSVIFSSDLDRDGSIQRDENTVFLYEMLLADCTIRKICNHFIDLMLYLYPMHTGNIVVQTGGTITCLK